MTEQTQIAEKIKKPGLLRRVFWWLWIVLLSVLLALGLFLAAPWKAITLIAIFIAAATILPRIYRKWFWAGVGVVILVLVIWVFLPEDNEGWRPYKFDKELAQLQARYAIPDSENAAILYENLPDSDVIDENEPEFFSEACQSAQSDLWKTAEHPETAQWLQEKEWIIDNVIEATKMDRCSFPVSSDPIQFSEALERFGKMRRLSYLLNASGNNAAAEGRMDEAVDKYISILRLGRHLCQQTSITEGLLGTAIESRAINCLKNIIITRDDVTEEHLKKIEKAIGDIDCNWISAIKKKVGEDKLNLKNMCGLICYQINEAGQVRLTRDPWATVREMIKKHEIDEKEIEADTEHYMKLWAYPAYWWKCLGKIYCIYIWFISPGGPDKLGEIVDKNYEKYYQKIETDWMKQKEPREIGSFMTTTNFSRISLNMEYFIQICAEMSANTSKRIRRSYIRHQCAKTASQIIIGLRRFKNIHGQWPQQLEDIKNYVSADTLFDPVNGDSFVYKLTEDNFMLYSKGENGIDEGGEMKTKFSKDYLKWETIKDDVKIWPVGRKTSKQQEVKEDDEQQ